MFRRTPLCCVAAKFGTLRVHGRDSTGIVAACTHLLDRRGCDIVKSEQWADRKTNLFFQRIFFDYATITNNNMKEAVEDEIQDLCRQLSLTSQLNWRDRKRRVGIMVSKYDHCLWELLLRHKANELDCDIPVVISNHEDLRSVSETFGIPYQVVPITPKTKVEQEQKQLEILLKKNEVDVVVLARYMQVLSDRFLKEFPNNIINIHHSFLPAFSGGKPYHRAYDRGVKLIGATAHYATVDLDEGPIIEQVG